MEKNIYKDVVGENYQHLPPSKRTRMRIFQSAREQFEHDSTERRFVSDDREHPTQGWTWGRRPKPKWMVCPESPESSSSGSTVSMSVRLSELEWGFNDARGSGEIGVSTESSDVALSRRSLSDDDLDRIRMSLPIETNWKVDGNALKLCECLSRSDWKSINSHSN